MFNALLRARAMTRAQSVRQPLTKVQKIAIALAACSPILAVAAQAFAQTSPAAVATAGTRRSSATGCRSRWWGLAPT